MLYDLLWWHVCHCWGMLRTAFHFDLHVDIPEDHVFILLPLWMMVSKQDQQEVGETFPPPEKGKGNLKSSSNRPGLCPLSFQPYENCMAVYSTRARTYQSHDVMVWYWGFISMFYVWFQTGNAWIITPRNSDICRGSLYLKVLMCFTSLWV